VLGCRGRGTPAARGYAAHPRCELVGLCDLRPELLDALGDELGVPAAARFTDLDTMMRTVKPQIVAIPVATELHYALCKRVLAYPGVHIEVRHGR
jgi:predicted dehydrogenase